MMKKEKEIKLEKLVLNVDGTKIPLTLDQAKKLKDILSDLFGKEIVKEVIHDHHYHDWWYRPCITYTGTSDVPQRLNDNIVYCSTSNSLEVTC